MNVQQPSEAPHQHVNETPNSNRSVTLLPYSLQLILVLALHRWLRHLVPQKRLMALYENLRLCLVM